MSDFSTEEWFCNILWPTYPRGLCNRIGSKSKALLSAKSKVKNETDANILIAGLREQIRYYQKIKKSGAHGSEWTLPMLSTWLNGERWTDEIPSHYELKQKQNTENANVAKKRIYEIYAGRVTARPLGLKTGVKKGSGIILYGIT